MKSFFFQFRNASDKTDTLCLEPWGWEYSIRAGQEVTVRVDAMDYPQLEVETRVGMLAIIVQGPAGADAVVLSDNLVMRPE